MSIKSKISSLWHNAKIREFVRFCIVGVGATLVDFLAMSLVLYLFEPEIYPDFISIFIGGKEDPSTVAAVVGTACGFIAGLIFNYILSVFFVYKENGNSKTVKGFILFALLSGGGFLIHVLGMYLGFDILGINEWIVKIVLTAVVLIYNYITRKIFILHKVKKEVAALVRNADEVTDETTHKKEDLSDNSIDTETDKGTTNFNTDLKK